MLNLFLKVSCLNFIVLSTTQKQKIVIEKSKTHDFD